MCTFKLETFPAHSKEKGQLPAYVLPSLFYPYAIFTPFKIISELVNISTAEHWAFVQCAQNAKALPHLSPLFPKKSGMRNQDCCAYRLNYYIVELINTCESASRHYNPVSCSYRYQQMLQMQHHLWHKPLPYGLRNKEYSPDPPTSYYRHSPES